MIECVRYEEKTHKKQILDGLYAASDEDLMHLGVSGGSEADLIATDGEYQVGFVAEDDGKVAGYAWTSYASFVSRAALRQCFVLPDFRGHGVASMLVDERLRFARTRWNVHHGIYCLTIENRPMERILQRYGFVKRGTWKDWVVVGNVTYDETLWMA